MEPFSPGNSLQKQLEELQQHMNQIVEEKRVVTAELSKSENAINKLMEQIVTLQKRSKVSVQDPSDKQELLTDGQKGEVCNKTQDEHQRELESDLCRLQQDIPNMEQCLQTLRHYLDLSERQRLRLIAVKEKFLMDGETENEEQSLLPALRRPNMEILTYKLGVKGFPCFNDEEGGSSSRSSLGGSLSTVADRWKCSVENFTNGPSKVNEDLSLTDCQKIIHHQKITIDDLTTQIYKQKFTISQLTKDLNHLRFLHQQILQMEQNQRSQEMKMLGLERQNDVYYISIVKLMEKNDELQKKLSNEQENDLNVPNTRSVLTICNSTATDARDLISEKFSQTVQNDDINEAIKDLDQESILKNLTRKDVQLKVMINMIARQNDRIDVLEQERKDDDAKIDTLKTDINHLTKEKGELKSHIDNLTRSIETLNGINEKLTSELLQMQETVAVNEELQQLQRENAALVKERDEAVISNNDLVMKYNNLRNHIGAFQPLVHSRKVRRLKSVLVKLKLNLRKNKALTNERTEQLSELQAKCEVLICKYDDVTLQSSEFLSQRDELQKDKDKLLSALESTLIEKEELEIRLNKRNRTICQCCLKLNREIMTLKGNIQHLHLQNEINLSEQETTFLKKIEQETIFLKKDCVAIQTKLNEANGNLRVTTEQLESEKIAKDKLLKNNVELQNKLHYLDYKYKGTIDKLGKDKSALQNDLNALDQKYAKLSEDNLNLQSKILEIEIRYSTQEETLQTTMAELKEQSDMVQQLTADLEEQSMQLELFQDNNILCKQKIESFCGEREIVEQQLQKTIKHLKRSELKYLSIRKLLVDIEAYVAGDSSEDNSEIFNLKISLKNCQDELFEVEDKLTDSLSAAKFFDEQVTHMSENHQKLNRCIIVLVTTWRGVLEKVMNVQVLLDQLAAVNLKSFTSLDKTIFQLHEQTCLTIELLGTLNTFKLNANDSGELPILPHHKCPQL
uniref:Uncharacterized protein n=1 Tax=Photinus pyralis TaxID=7054 RepID=A0A1Y1N7Q6_PHOPY